MLPLGRIEMSASTRPPGPKGHPLLGQLPELRRDWLGTLTRYAREYGDFVPLRIGPKRAVLLSHPEHVEEVLVSKHRGFVKPPALRNNRRLLGNGLLTSEGDFWRRQHRLCQPAFQKERLAAYGEVMVGCAERLIEAWRDGEDRDVYADMAALTLEAVARTLFGVEVRDEAADVSAALGAVHERFIARLDNPLLVLLPDALPLPGNLAYLRAVARLDRIVYRVIERRRASGEDGGDLLSMLLRARGEDGSRMSDRQLRDEVMNVFLAGHETNALALAWTWYLLAQHPQVESGLLAELRAVLGGRVPTVADLPRLEYAGRVVTEALRLYPPVWLIGREALRDCEIGGHRVPRGAIVLMSPWVLQRDPRFFERPDEFDPDRWADGLARRLPRLAYFPFSGGPRACIGGAFAMTEAVLVLATIAERFRLSLLPGRSVNPRPLITLRPRGGVPVVVHRRFATPQDQDGTLRAIAAAAAKKTRTGRQAP